MSIATTKDRKQETKLPVFKRHIKMADLKKTKDFMDSEWEHGFVFTIKKL